MVTLYWLLIGFTITIIVVGNEREGGVAQSPGTESKRRAHEAESKRLEARCVSIYAGTRGEP